MLTHLISAVSFDRIDNTIFDLLDNACVIAASVKTVICPIEEYYHSCLRFFVLVKPLTFSLEPISAVIDDGILRNDTVLDIATLIGAPTDETAAPLDTGAKAVPRPIRLSADIAQKIQEEMTYPGQVKITVIRETRSVSYAK